MKSISKRRRAWIPTGTDLLEGRVMLSSSGRAGPAPSPALVGDTPTLGREEARPIRPSRQAAAPAPATAARWSWLAGSYWFVPTRNLSAVLYDSTTNTLAPVSDQTVFQITGYSEGYFWGESVTQLDGSSVTGTSMVGSVTPQGRVLLTFTQASDGSSPSVTEGYGTMQRKDGRWTMENQMFTSTGDGIQVGHWAYMVPTSPGLPSWDSLPGSGLSVPAFLDQWDGSGPEPIASPS